MKGAFIFVLLIAFVCAQGYIYPSGVVDEFSVWKPASDGCNRCRHQIMCYGPNRTRCIDTGSYACTLLYCVKAYVPKKEEYFDYIEDGSATA